jgi:hypothetical protein
MVYLILRIRQFWGYGVVLDELSFMYVVLLILKKI